MTNEDIIRMAREAGLDGVTVWSEEKQADVLRPELECLAYSAFVAGALAEREACAKVCDEVNKEYDGEEVSASWIAAAIRARGQ